MIHGRVTEKSVRCGHYSVALGYVRGDAIGDVCALRRAIDRLVSGALDLDDGDMVRLCGAALVQAREVGTGRRVAEHDKDGAGGIERQPYVSETA